MPEPGVPSETAHCGEGVMGSVHAKRANAIRRVVSLFEHRKNFGADYASDERLVAAVNEAACGQFERFTEALAYARACRDYFQIAGFAPPPTGAGCADVERLRFLLSELADLMDAVHEGDYRPDSFTTQPARIELRRTATPNKEGGE